LVVPARSRRLQATDINPDTGIGELSDAEVLSLRNFIEGSSRS